MTGARVTRACPRSPVSSSRSIGPASSTRATPSASFERGLVQVDVHDRVAVLGAVAVWLGFAGEQGGDVFGVGQPAQGDRAELVAGAAVGQVGDQLAAGVQGVGDPVHDRVEPDRVGRDHRRDHGAQPVLVGRGDRDIAAAQPGVPLFLGGLGVGFHHLGLGDGQQSPRPLVDSLDHGPVHQRGGRRVEPAGHRGDLAGDPQVAASLPERGVELWEPVSQVEPVGHQRPHGQAVLTPRDGELTDREVQHPRGPGTTELHQPGRTRRPWLSVVVGIVGVQVGPVQRELELTHLGGPPVPHRRLHGSQRLGGVEVLDGEKAGRFGHDSTQALTADSRPGSDIPIPQDACGGSVA